MLYYVYDSKFSLQLNVMLEQITEQGVQQTSSLLTKNTLVSFAYFYLFQVSYQLIINSHNDATLGIYQSPLLFIITDSAACKFAIYF